MSEVVAAPEAVVTHAAPPGAPAPQAPATAPAEAGKPDQNTANTAPAAPTGEKKPDTPDPAEKRGTSRFERKISRLHREAAEQRARADLLERQLTERSKPAEDPGAPKLEHFKDIEEYANAKAKFESDKVLKEHHAKQQNETQKQAHARLTEAWEERAERGESKYEDFGEVVGDLKPTTPWAQAIMEAENGEEIAYYLGTHLKEAQRIVGLPPLSQVREIGRLEAKLLAEPAVKPQKPSAAPAPIAPLTGTNAPPSDGPSDKDSMRDWMAKRQRQVHGARQSRK